jgi:hypothetical protein
VVMSITFPDGTKAEVVYPALLDLGTEYVHPGAFTRGVPKGCYEEIHFSRSQVVGSWIAPEPPLAVFEGVHGDPVALWPGKRWLQPLDVLAFDFGDWVAAFFCEVDPGEDADDLSAVARSLDARPTGDGLVTVSARGTLRLVQDGFQVGPRVTLENPATPDSVTLVQLTITGCAPSPSRIVQRSTTHRCFQGGIELYAAGRPSFLKAVAEGLEVRNVKPSSG